jgi:hypothetical protein
MLQIVVRKLRLAAGQQRKALEGFCKTSAGAQTQKHICAESAMLSTGVCNTQNTLGLLT